MNHEEFLRLASRHADGVTTEEEQRQLDEHVRSCRICMKDVEESSAEAEALAAAGHEDTPVAHRRPFFRWWLGAATIFFLALFGWSELRFNVQREDVLQLQANLDQLTMENARLASKRGGHVSAASVIAGAKTVVVPLMSADSSEAAARVFIDPAATHGYLFVHALPSSGRDRYQLWALQRDGSPARRLATFEVKAPGDAAVAIDNAPAPDSVAGFIITRESPAVSAPGIPVLRSTL